jgi:hypothetical protein
MKKPRHLDAQLFFKDQKGRVVLWQWPNIPLCGWALSKFFAVIVNNPSMESGFSNLGTSLLFVWAYLELTNGVNYFRRLIGLAVLSAICISFFMNIY